MKKSIYLLLVVFLFAGCVTTLPEVPEETYKTYQKSKLHYEKEGEREFSVYDLDKYAYHYDKDGVLLGRTKNSIRQWREEIPTRPTALHEMKMQGIEPTQRQIEVATELDNYETLCAQCEIFDRNCTECKESFELLKIMVEGKQ